MNIYNYLDYRRCLSDYIDHLKDRGLRLNHSSLSDAIRIQKTYTSRVLRRQAHFNADQLYECCRFLNFNADETDYILMLMEAERSTSEERQKILQQRIHNLQQERLKIQNHSRAKMVEPAPSESYLEYYMDPRLPLIHTFFHVENFKSNPDKIRETLGMTHEQFKLALNVLHRLDIVIWNQATARYDLKVPHLHLTKESPLSFPSEQLTRLMVLDHMKKLNRDQRFYYSFTFAADKKTRKFIHEEFLKFLRTTEAVIREAPSEEVFHMSFDLFSWFSKP